MEYQDWVYDECWEYEGDPLSLMEWMDNPVKWYTLPSKYPRLLAFE